MLPNIVLLLTWQTNACILRKFPKNKTLLIGRTYTTCISVSKNLVLSGLIKNKVMYNQMREQSYYQHKYSSKLEEAVNNQIQTEQQAAQDYLAMAVIFLHPCVARPGAGGFFMNMYEEELRHMQDFVQYQLLRGGMVSIKSLNTPPVINNLTLFEAFKRALDMEKSVTMCLEKVVSIAESVKDYQCADFVTAHFLTDQMKSINELAHHVTKLCRLCDEHSVYHYDLKLAKLYPYKYVSKTVK